MKKTFFLFLSIILMFGCSAQNSEGNENIHTTSRDDYVVITSVNGSILNPNNAVNNFAKDMVDIVQSNDFGDNGVIFRGVYEQENEEQATGILVYFRNIGNIASDYDYSNFYSDSTSIWTHRDFENAENMVSKSSVDIPSIPDEYYYLMSKPYQESDILTESEIEKEIAKYLDYSTTFLKLKEFDFENRLIKFDLDREEYKDDVIPVSEKTRGYLEAHYDKLLNDYNLSFSFEVYENEELIEQL